MAIVLTAMAGGMGWGIRGQYGHETGAMIAGVLVGLTLVLLFLPRATSLKGARAVALVAVGVGFGGSMTYGQTVGLTHDAPLIGNAAARAWGLLGLFIKGGLWIGFAGAFLGLGFSAKRYRPTEMTLVMLAMLGLFFLGVWLINSPFDPANRVLPRFYFSADWRWQPGAELKPRPEIWGGMALALAGLVAYVRFVRRDAFARNMALVGFLAGGLGFSLGQSLQSFHAWHPEVFKSLLGEELHRHVNWWNMMETSFGAVFGGVLALGLWLNRRGIAPAETPAETPDEVTVPPEWEFVLLSTFVALLLGAEFADEPALEAFIEIGFVIGVLPLVPILGGRYGPYLFALPIVALTICGKTLREMAYNTPEMSKPAGWTLLVVIPLAVTLGLALWLARKGKEGQTSRAFARIALPLAVWLYFALNFAFFRIPWPWTQWTGRTPSGIIFFVCAVALSTAAVGVGRVVTRRRSA